MLGEDLGEHAAKKACVEREDDTPQRASSPMCSSLDNTATSSSAPPVTTTPPDVYEQEHVHNVYSAIAGHFSSTRYKAWPQVKSFLEGLPPHSWIADVGCGNGKYFAACQRRTADARTEQTSTDTDTVAETTTPSCALALCKKDEANCTHMQTNYDQDNASLRSERDVRTTGDEVTSSSPTVPTHRLVIGMDYSVELLRLTQRTMADPNMPAHQTRTHNSPNQPVCGAGLSRLSSHVWQHESMPPIDVLRCDGRACPLQPGIFDAAISIAVIHHCASEAGRIASVQELLRLVRPKGGLVLIYVWALEQQSQPRPKRMIVNEATGDALVRWEMHNNFSSTAQAFERYYHLFRQGELEELCREAAERARVECTMKRSYFDKENWCVLLERG